MGRKPAVAKSTASSARSSSPVSMDKFVSEVRQRAFEIYLQRGKLPGAEVSDWVRAEREIKAKYGIR